MNKVTEVFSGMTSEELVLAIKEMKEDSLQGIIRVDGIVREKCAMVHKIAGGSLHDHLMMSQFAILQEAAYRFTPTLDELTHSI
jgi:hypothetical protein